MTGRQELPGGVPRNAGNLFGRGALQQNVTTTDAIRLSNINQTDARIEKDFHFNDFGMTLGVDCFNDAQPFHGPAAPRPV